MAVEQFLSEGFKTLQLIFTYGWPFILLIVIFIQKSSWKKWPIEAVIIEKRGDNLIKTNDRVGRFFDKTTDQTFYKLKSTGDTIPVYNFDWVLHNNAVSTNFLEKYISMLRGNAGTVFLFKYGSKQYKPINVGEGNLERKFAPVKNDRGESVYSYQYVQVDPRDQVGALDFEVIDWDNMNFMVQEQRASIVRRQKKGEFWKQTLVPLAIIAGSVVVSIFILKFSLDAGHSLQGAAAPPPAENALDGSKIGGAIGGALNPGE